jgi:hypothetical protein
MTTHDTQAERYSEPYAEPPAQKTPTTYDLHAAAAQGDAEAARQLETYVARFVRPAISEDELHDAVADSLAGKHPS